MLLTRFALRNPVAVTLFYVFVGIIGMTAVFRMGRSILPPVSFPIVTVAAPYPGAGPAELERLVVEPIEDELDQTPDVDRVSASAQDGIAELTVRFRFGSDLDVDRTNVQHAVDAARVNLPADLVPPAVSKDDPAQAPILEESIDSAVVPAGELSRLVDREIVPALRATPGVGTVLSAGRRVRQLTIVPRLAALDALGATAADVLGAAARANDVFPGGRLETALRESTIGIAAAAVTRDQLENLPLRIPGGPSVRLRDVAAVEDGYAERAVIARVDGDDAIVVSVAHRPDADSIRTIGNVKATFARLAERYPLVRFGLLRTDGPATSAAVAGVLQTLGEGIVLTVLVMLFFLHAWRNALIAAVAIPASLCAAFAAMWLCGFTINVLSLMGLSLTIGILVDDAIVIIEAVTRNAQCGLRGDEAALAGRRELGAAAIAITLVDVAVFTPIALMSGIIGEFMREFGLVIVFATAFSLLVALTLTPLLAARWALRHERAGLERLGHAAIRSTLGARARQLPWTFRAGILFELVARWHAAINAFNAWELGTRERYAAHWLPFALRRRRVVLVLAAGACITALVPVMTGAIPSEFSPPIDRGEVTVDLTFPAGTPLARSDTAVRRVSQALLANADVKHVVTTAGRAFNGRSDVFAGNVAEIGIVLTDPTGAGSGIVELAKSLQPLVPDAAIAGAGRGMGGTAPISYLVAGDADVIDVAANRIANALRSNPDAADVRTSDGGLGPHLQIDVDSRRALLLDVAPDDAAQVARIATGGAIATKARRPDGLVDVVVRADAAKHGDIDTVRRMPVRAADARIVPLGAVTSIASTRGPTVIERENRERVVSVTANTRNDAPIGSVTTPMRALLRDPNFLPPGARIQPRGDVEQFIDAVTKMATALGLSIVAVYAILAMLYRSYTLPLVIMATVPLASVGAFGSLFVLNALRNIFPNAAVLNGQTLNLYSMLGIIMLVGLVAKNGILLVEYAEREVRDGRDVAEAIRLAARRRFRPIVMTTMAMIAGMLPLALGHTIGAEYRKALGTVVIGGLSSSLLLTLFVIPIVYVACRARTSQTKVLYPETLAVLHH